MVEGRGGLKAHRDVLALLLAEGVVVDHVPELVEELSALLAPPRAHWREQGLALEAALERRRPVRVQRDRLADLPPPKGSLEVRPA